MGFESFNNKYIKFYGSVDGRYNTVVYKIIDKTSIDELINNIKGEIEIKEE